MDRNRWKTVNEIFHAALEIPASERREFVCTASGGDPDLQSEVDRLLEADRQAGSYLESPLLPGEPIADPEASPSPFKSGDVLKSRFRINRQVGEGGMGHVFDAFDTELKVRVALKAIRSEIAGNPTALEFFRREVRTARTITHPNVCRTFDLDRGSLSEAAGTPREFFFLTMEFLEGETLAARLNRTSPLDTREALVIARQIASGLDAAHAAGIVHRDIKPANIMLVASPNGSGPQTRAVITDFGLARQNPLHSSIAASAFSHGSTVGTLAYMAPEQLEPGRSASAATDVYAFGLVLFEMVTGARAFPSANLLSGIAQRLAGPPPSPRALIPQLPEVWETVIQCCLRLAPEDRFQSASQVVEALGGAAPILPSIFRPTVPINTTLPIRIPWSRRRRFLVAAAVLLAVVALSVVGFRLYRSSTDSKVSPGALVYLAPVKNETGEQALDNLTELLQAGLSQSAQINLLDQSRVGDALQWMTKLPDTPIDAPVAREIAMRTGAVRVIFATVTRSAGGYQLNVDIQQPEAASPSRYRDHWPMSFSWKVPSSTISSATIPQELLTAVRNSTDWIRLEIGESRNDIARMDDPPEDVTTGSWDSLREYLRGRSLSKAGKPLEAIEAFHNAVSLDPQFALAYADMADVLLTVHREEEGFRDYKLALDPALGRRLTRRERDRIAGMYALDSWDFAASVDAFKDYESFYPKDGLGWIYPEFPLRMLGRSQEAITDLERAVELMPGSVSPRLLLADEFLLEGNFDDAKKWISKSKELESSEDAATFEGFLAFLQGRYEEAEKLLAAQTSVANPRSRSRAYERLADLLAERGLYSEAIAALDQGMKEDVAQGNVIGQSSKLICRAWMEAKNDRFSESLEDIRHSIQLSSSPQNRIMAGEVLGRTLAIAPEPVGSKIRDEIIAIDKREFANDFGVISEVSRLRVHGEAQLAQGKSADAVKTFREAAAIGSPIEAREYLGRALLAASIAEHDVQRKNELRHQALASFAVVALRPSLVWSYPISYTPGFYADELRDYISLALELKPKNSTAKAKLSEFVRLRPNEVEPVLKSAGPTKRRSS